MIHVFLGTKAQLIKMAPIMKELERRNITYNFIFSGQHQETIADLRENFQIKQPDIVLHKGEDVNTITKMFFWMIKVIYFTFRNRPAVWQGDKNGIVLNHGDTFSTLLGSILAKLSGLKNAHIESGLRSFNLFHPFPEELTRIAVFKMTDVYFCPNEHAALNLKREKGIKIDTNINTLYDALEFILESEKNSALDVPQNAFAIASIHRFETLYQKEKLITTIDLIKNISKSIPVLFILHSPTKVKLEKQGLLKTLQDDPNIELRPRYDYANFIQLVSSSQFVVTDGGSNQEECFYLGKPCLLFREATERDEGLDENVVLSRFNPVLVEEFVENFENYRRPFVTVSESPSCYIVERLLELGYDKKDT